METTGNVGECRFRGTEGAVGGKEMEAASEAQMLRGRDRSPLRQRLSVQSTVLYGIGETVCVLKELWLSLGKQIMVS